MSPLQVIESFIDDLKALPARERTALMQWLVEGKTLESIAADMGVSYEGVRKMALRAKGKLSAGLHKKLLAEKGQKPVTPPAPKGYQVRDTRRAFFQQQQH